MLGPFIEAMQDLTDAIYTDTAASGPIPERYTLETPDNWFERAKGARLDFMHATAMAGIGGGAAAFGLSAAAGSSTLVASILASSLIPPLAVFLAVGAGIWAVAQGFGGWKRVEQTQLKSAQQELHKHLVDVRERVRRFYFNVDLKSGRLQSLVDEHFDQLVTGVGETLQRLAVVKSAEARDEQARLAEQAKLDEQQRAARLAELRGHVAQWDQVGQTIQGVIQELTGLEQSLMGLTSHE